MNKIAKRRYDRRRRKLDVREMGRLGGRARAQRLTPEERSRIAAKGGRAAKRARLEKQLKKPGSKLKSSQGSK